MTDQQSNLFSSMLELDRVARRVLCGDRDRDQWSEPEQHAMAIVRSLAVTLSRGPADDALPQLRAALAKLQRSDAVRWRAHDCARAVGEWAERWRQPETQASAEGRAWALDGLVHELSAHDLAFEALAAQHQLLARTLDAYDSTPQGKRGKMGATRVLAELIVEGEIEALGIVDDLTELEGPTVADVRDKLDRLIARCRAQTGG